VQHELLKAVRRLIPHASERAENELGLTIPRTQEPLDKRIEIISAARAIKLARMIAYDPHARDVFSETGQNVSIVLSRQFSGVVKATVRGLPRLLRVRSALSLTRQIAHGFAGSLNQIVFERRGRGFALTVFDGVFSDRLDTLGCAHAYYRGVFETIFRQFALKDCEVIEVRRSRVHLNQCNFEIVWEA
jgi:bacteriochlorophyll 4-vinyl reductase